MKPTERIDVDTVTPWLMDSSGVSACGSEMLRDPAVARIWTPRGAAVVALVESKVREAVSDMAECAAMPVNEEACIARVLGREVKHDVR